MREAHLGGVLRYALAAASLGAGLLHISAVFDHTDHPTVATFFVFLAAAQLSWALAVVLRPAPGLLKAGAILSVGVVAIWLISRTTGWPGVPGAEEREAFGLKDGIASALEVALAIGVGAHFAAWGQTLRLASGRLASGLAVSVIGVLTAAGLSAPGHHSRGEAGHGHPGSMATGHHDAGADAAHSRSDANDHGGGHDNAAADEHAAGSHDHHAGGSDLASVSTHEHAAAPDHQHEDGHVPGDADHVHGDPAASHALAAGHSHTDAEHDHNAPGHVHDPSHHHHHGSSSSQPEGHEAGSDHEASHDADHDHGAGHDHGDGTHDDHETCTSPLPENQVLTTLQQAAQSTLGVGCHVANRYFTS